MGLRLTTIQEYMQYVRYIMIDNLGFIFQVKQTRNYHWKNFQPQLVLIHFFYNVVAIMSNTDFYNFSNNKDLIQKFIKRS